MNFEHKNLMKNILLKINILNLISFAILTKIITYSFTYLNNNIIKDLEENWNLNPINNINLTSNENNIFKKPKKNVDFLGAFSKINKNLIKTDFIPNEYLTNDLYFNKWESKNFILNRSKNYEYKRLFSNKKNLTKICGTDNNGNNLYFPINENCPLNFIEITNKKTPSLNFSYYETIKLNNNKYLHYSNQNIKGKIIVQLRVGGNNKNYKNNLCLEKDSSIFNFNFIIENLLSIKNKFNCHFDNRYYELDEMNLTDFLIDNDFNIYIDNVNEFLLKNRLKKKFNIDLSKINNNDNNEILNNSSYLLNQSNFSPNNNSKISILPPINSSRITNNNINNTSYNFDKNFGKRKLHKKLILNFLKKPQIENILIKNPPLLKFQKIQEKEKNNINLAYNKILNSEPNRNNNLNKYKIKCSQVDFLTVEKILETVKSNTLFNNYKKNIKQKKNLYNI